jgi:hypothetical protein
MRKFDDIIEEAACQAIIQMMTPLQFYKQCFLAYEEALKQQQKDDWDQAHQVFRQKFREMAKQVDPRQAEGPYY